MTNLMRWLRNSLFRVQARRSPESRIVPSAPGHLPATPKPRHDPEMQNFIYYRNGKMVRRYQDKSLRAGRDYSDKEMCP